VSHVATQTQTQTRSVLSSSAVMAAGTIVSRASGFVRTALLAAAIGSTLHADVFNLPNTVPNMLYILVAGGVFNAVLVPQLVRAMRTHLDEGISYVDRLITLAAAFLLVVTVLLVVGAPWLMHLFLHGDWYSPHRAAELSSAIAFARWCLPQIFFYGMFVLIGQILNARGRFGPMMWAPIANNLISIGILIAYMVVWGHTNSGGYSTGQQVLLGLGSTVGIAAQFFLLLPSLRAVGYRWTPRWDWRGTGLGHTMRLGIWTVLFVVANQVAYTVVASLASGGSAGGHNSAGYTVYSNAFLVTQVPHAVITVSLTTAVLPRLSAAAAAGDYGALAGGVASTLRSAMAIVVPAACLLAVLATDVAHVLFGYGASRSVFHLYAAPLVLFAPGMVFFTIHYVVLRGFYAVERNRTVFYIQCAVAGTNIVAALVLVHLVTADEIASALTAAYGLSFLVGAMISTTMLRRAIGGAGSGLISFYLRLALITAVATAWSATFHAALLTYDRSPGLLVSLFQLVAVSGVFVCVVALGAQYLGLSELTSLFRQVARRLRVVRG